MMPFLFRFTLNLLNFEQSIYYRDTSISFICFTTKICFCQISSECNILKKIQWQPNPAMLIQLNPNCKLQVVRDLEIMVSSLC